jgi:uncharacterized metal-binding protein
MNRYLDRRRFLTTAGTGIATGVAVSASTECLLAGDAPPDIPVPDAHTREPVPATDSEPVCCDPASTLIFACSGAADVGEIADHAARKLTKDGAGKMFCLAGIGGRVPGIMENTRKAKTLLVIDGCPLQCSRNSLEKAGFREFKHVCLSDLGMAKGKTPVTDENEAAVADHAKRMLKT